MKKSPFDPENFIKSGRRSLPLTFYFVDAVTMPDFNGNDGSLLVIERSLHAVPSGWFLPASHASTVLTDTPINFANKTCVSPVLLRILFISDGVNVSGGVIERVTVFADRLPFSYSIA